MKTCGTCGEAIAPQSTVCPFCNGVFKGTMAPSTRAPRQRWPRLVCTE